MKTIIITATGLAMLATSSMASMADASGSSRKAHWNWSYKQAVAMRAPGGRCRGISSGTGARSCGTATGGPVGGLSSRN